MNNYKYTICDPAFPNVIDKGRIDKDDIPALFANYPWSEGIAKVKSMKEPNYSPSLGIFDKDANKAIEFSAVEDDALEYTFMIFYQRPKTVKRFFGLFEARMEDYSSDITDQAFEVASELLDKFLLRRWEYLEEVFSK